MDLQAIDKVFIWLAVGLVTGLVLFWKGFGWLRLRRLIQNIPTSKVRSIAMGLVEVNGTVAPSDEPLPVAPFTEKPCVYFHYCVEEWRQRGKRGSWVTVREGIGGCRFWLRDDTGQVLVDPAGATVEIPADFRCESRLGKDPPVNVRQFLTREGLSFEGWLGANKSMRFREEHIAPQDTLYVMGTAMDNPLCAEATAQQGHDDVMIAHGGDLFYLSDRPEHAIVRRLAWKTLGGIGGGAALAVVALVGILAKLQLVTVTLFNLGG